MTMEGYEYSAAPRFKKPDPQPAPAVCSTCGLADNVLCSNSWHLLTPQDLRDIASRIEQRCDQALTQSAERGPCMICRNDSAALRKLADRMETPA